MKMPDDTSKPKPWHNPRSEIVHRPGLSERIDDWKIKGWMGPIVGPIAGVLTALWTVPDDDDIPIKDWLLSLAGIGFAAGVIVWWIDVRRNRRK